MENRMTDTENQQHAAPPSDSPAGRVRATLVKFKPAIFKFLVGHLLGLAGLLTGILTLANGVLDVAVAIPLIVFGAAVELWAVVQIIKAMPKEKCPQCGRRLVQGKINGRTFRDAFRACSNCGANLWKSDGKILDSEEHSSPAASRATAEPFSPADSRDSSDSFSAADTLSLDDENPYGGS